VVEYCTVRVGRWPVLSLTSLTELDQAGIIWRAF